MIYQNIDIGKHKLQYKIKLYCTFLTFDSHEFKKISIITYEHIPLIDLL